MKDFNTSQVLLVTLISSTVAIIVTSFYYEREVHRTSVEILERLPKAHQNYRQYRAEVMHFKAELQKTQQLVELLTVERDLQLVRGIPADFEVDPSPSHPLDDPYQNLLAQRPHKGVIVSTLRQVNYQRCADLNKSLQGIVRVRVKVVKTGEVTRARVRNLPFRGSKMARCLERAIKRVRFDPFIDQSVEFTFPYKL